MHGDMQSREQAGCANVQLPKEGDRRADAVLGHGALEFRCMQAGVWEVAIEVNSRRSQVDVFGVGVGIKAAFVSGRSPLWSADHPNDCLMAIRGAHGLDASAAPLVPDSADRDFRPRHCHAVGDLGCEAGSCLALRQSPVERSGQSRPGRRSAGLARPTTSMMSPALRRAGCGCKETAACVERRPPRPYGA